MPFGGRLGYREVGHNFSVSRILPGALYKYGRFNEHGENVIINGTVWFSAPDELNDPFECRPDGLHHLSQGALRSVTVGLASPDAEVQMLRVWNSRRAVPARLYRAVRDPRRFQLHIEPI